MTMTARRQPFYWQLPVYVEMGLVGLMGICFAFIPETPWYHGRRGNKEGCFKSMRRLYGNVDEYNQEEEWGIIARSVEHERELLEQTSAVSWSSIFRGTNGVGRTALVIELLADRSETYVHTPARLHRSTGRRQCPYVYLFDLLLPTGRPGGPIQRDDDSELRRPDRDSVLFRGH
jgi:hypothetical protein